MSVRKGCELTPMTRLVSRLCSGVRLLANGMLMNSVRRLQIGGKFATYFRQRLNVVCGVPNYCLCGCFGVQSVANQSSLRQIFHKMPQL